jgi:FkbH-like protein
MEISFAPFDKLGRARIAQLILRSNQFNLTTRRYTEAETAEWERDPQAFTLQVRLADKFGDNGIISVVICRRNGPAWVIDTWLMSCRVLSRRVEEAVLDELVENARRAGAGCLVGLYRRTERNALVKDHYRNLGFLPVGETDEGEEWHLDVTAYQSRRPPMRIKRSGDVAT